MNDDSWSLYHINHQNDIYLFPIRYINLVSQLNLKLTNQIILSISTEKHFTWSTINCFEMFLSFCVTTHMTYNRIPDIHFFDNRIKWHKKRKWSIEFLSYNHRLCCYNLGLHASSTKSHFSICQKRDFKLNSKKRSNYTEQKKNLSPFQKIAVTSSFFSLCIVIHLRKYF